MSDERSRLPSRPCRRNWRDGGLAINQCSASSDPIWPDQLGRASSVELHAAWSTVNSDAGVCRCEVSLRGGTKVGCGSRPDLGRRATSMTTVRHYTASAVVLDDADRMLLVHHNKIGQWLYPGGHIDSNEDPAQAALREVREETGIQAVIIGEPAFSHPAVRSHAAPWAIIEMDVTDSKVGAHRHIDLVRVPGLGREPGRAAGGSQRSAVGRAQRPGGP